MNLSLSNLNVSRYGWLILAVTDSGFRKSLFRDPASTLTKVPEINGWDRGNLERLVMAAKNEDPRAAELELMLHRIATMLECEQWPCPRMKEYDDELDQAMSTSATTSKR